MSLADGEYEIDLSEAFSIDVPTIEESENIAIRYGFVPDSMDQSKPLRLYQNDQELLLRANSTDGPEKPIIFEGLAQKHKGNDTYYLTFNPEEPNNVSLRQLHSTIRFSKSRNASNLQTKLGQWEKDAKDRQTSAKPSPRPTKKKTPPLPASIPATPVHQSYTPSSSRSTLSAKRPPTANNTPEPKREDPIISESDFDDLNDFDFGASDEAFKGKSAAKKRTKKEPKTAKATEPKKQPNVAKTTEAKKRAKKIKSAPIIERVDREDSMDLDDDFKDLEDQLQEVLEEEESKSPEEVPFNIQIVDSDESDADEYSSFKPSQIVVVDGDSASSKPPRDSFSNTRNSNQKPMSLREMIGDKGKQDEDLSSSEAE